MPDDLTKVNEITRNNKRRRRRGRRLQAMPGVPLDETIAELADMLGVTFKHDDELAGATKGDINNAVVVMRQMMAEITELQAALEPFAEIARRFGWDRYDADDRRLGDHLIEAPASDIAPGCAYCLMVGAFWRAAHMLNGDDDATVAAATLAPDLPPPVKRWWNK
jgi:hypothetical protein